MEEKSNGESDKFVECGRISCLCSPPKNGTISDLYTVFSDGLKVPTAERMCFADVRVALQLRERINKRPK